MYAFTFLRPTTVRQAVNLLAKHEDAKLLAGGHSLIPVMKLRLANPPVIIDLSKVEGISGVELKGRSIVVGAMTKHADVANSRARRRRIFRRSRKCRARSAIRMCAQGGTIGGSVANNDPNADYPAACLGLGATIITSKRKIPADEFFTGMFSTALEPDEIITKISVPDRQESRLPEVQASGVAALRWSACSCPSAARISAWR